MFMFINLLNKLDIDKEYKNIKSINLRRNFLFNFCLIMMLFRAKIFDFFETI
jgi:hypothetical protein